MRSILLSLTFSLLAVPAAFAQTPTPWPLACPVPATLANNGTAPLVYSPCTPTVQNAQGQIVLFGMCLGIDLLLPPGETVTSYWFQQDEFGQQVPPGVYFVSGVPFDIGAAAAGITNLGAPHVGVTRRLELCSPTDANAPYIAAAAFSSTVGVPLGCGRTFPLDFDVLLQLSLTSPATFVDFAGVLDGAGRSLAPAIVLPNATWLVGLSFEQAFATLDASAPCGIGRISAAVPTTIV